VSLGGRARAYALANANLKTKDGVYTDSQRGVHGSWLKDPDGNIIALAQLPET
jgi:hypothetical protein